MKENDFIKLEKIPKFRRTCFIIIDLSITLNIFQYFYDLKLRIVAHLS